MAEYIKREDAIRAIENLQDCYNGFSDTYDKACIIGTFEELPAADVVERKTGKWKFDKCVWVCSCCGKNPTVGMGYVQSRDDLYSYCPNCGADMRGETQWESAKKK